MFANMGQDRTTRTPREFENIMAKVTHDLVESGRREIFKIEGWSPQALRAEAAVRLAIGTAALGPVTGAAGESRGNVGHGRLVVRVKNKTVGGAPSWAPVWPWGWLFTIGYLFSRRVRARVLALILWPHDLGGYSSGGDSRSFTSREVAMSARTLGTILLLIASEALGVCYGEWSPKLFVKMSPRRSRSPSSTTARRTSRCAARGRARTRRSSCAGAGRDVVRRDVEAMTRIAEAAPLRSSRLRHDGPGVRTRSLTAVGSGRMGSPASRVTSRDRREPRSRSPSPRDASSSPVMPLFRVRLDRTR